MRAMLNRRRFLGAGFGSCALLACRSVLARHYTPEGFTDSDREFLRDAVGYALWMNDDDIIQNYANLHGDSYYLAGGVWEKSNNEVNPNPDWRKKSNLLEYQVKNLADPPEELPLYIEAFHERSDVWGKVYDLGTAAVISDGEGKYTVEGYFKIYLNTYLLNANSEPENSPRTWGAVIAHEMLHCLGHMHEKGDYDDHWPMNLFENCVGYGGHYTGDGVRHFNWNCGGRVNS